jgi:hypothetical protein
LDRVDEFGLLACHVAPVCWSSRMITHLSAASCAPAVQYGGRWVDGIVVGHEPDDKSSVAHIDGRLRIT